MNDAIAIITQEIDRIESALVWLQDHNASRTLRTTASIESETLYALRAHLQTLQRNHDDTHAITTLFNRVVNVNHNGVNS